MKKCVNEGIIWLGLLGIIIDNIIIVNNPSVVIIKKIFFFIIVYLLVIFYHKYQKSAYIKCSTFYICLWIILLGGRCEN